MEINKLFVISKNEMMLKAIELYGKRNNLEFFVINDLEESTHFIADLKPEAILLDPSELEADQVKGFVKDHRHIFIVLLHRVEGIDINNLDGRLEPTEVAKLIYKLKSEAHGG